MCIRDRRDKEERDREAGKGFRMQIVNQESLAIGTIGKDYQKNRSTEPTIAHPIEGERLLRLLTPNEHARIKGMPEQLVEGMPATRAHAILGNGVVFEPFLAVGKALAKAVLSVRPQPLALVS
jgi:DNA (cytosine-5)-methyltransferase 1